MSSRYRASQRLADALDPSKAPGPVKNWAEMSPEERARIAAEVKPPASRQRPIAPAPRPPPPDVVQVACIRKLRETEKAALYVLPGGEQKWVPKSVITDEDEMDDGAVLLDVKGWFSRKEGLDG
jgi:hypothetical protein